MSRPLKPFISRIEFDKAIRVVGNEITAADLTYVLFTRIDGLTRSHKSVYKRTWAFWLNITGALQQNVVLDLCRIYDSDYRTTGLPVILGKVLAGQTHPDPVLLEHQRLVHRSDPIVGRLSKWREEVLAHTNRDRAVGARRTNHKQLLLKRDLNTLIDRAVEIYSGISGSCMSRAVNKELVPSKDADFVFQTLQARIDADICALRAWLEERGVDPDKFDPDLRL